MPLNGSGVASKPSGTTAVAGATIESAKFNSIMDDVYSIFNTARPIAYGGTGATTASGARTALGLAIGTDVASAAQGALADTAIQPTLLTTRGDIIYRNATVPARLPKGTAGQVLTMGADDPQWADAGMTLINSTQPTTDVASITLTGLSSASNLTLVASLSRQSAGNSNLRAEFRTSGGTWRTPIIVAFGTTSGKTYSFAATVFNFGETRPFKHVGVGGSSSSSTMAADTVIGSLYYYAEVWDEVRLTFADGGNFSGSVTAERGYLYAFAS